MRAVLFPLWMTLVFPSALLAQGTWTLLPSSPSGAQNGRHEDISFPTTERGYIVNFNGELYQTLDGGDSWDLLHTVETVTEDPVRLRSVAFANENRGWIGALTPGYILWQTQDGGATLTNITSRVGLGNDRGICGLWAVSEQVVYGVGRYFGPARLYMTKDGGLTWTVRDMGQYAGRLVDVFFFDELNGFVVGGTSETSPASRAVVLRTTDGGETWKVVYTSRTDGEWAWKISFPTTSVGYVSVERFPLGVGRVLKTGDRGDTWSEIVITGSRPLQGIGFVTNWQGWAGGRGTTHRTRDGGITWQEDNTALDAFVNRFRMFGDTLGYAVGNRVYRYEGKTQVASETFELPETKRLLGQNFPNPFYPLTTFEYEVDERAHVEIAVYDLLGRLVKILVSGDQSSGAQRASWDGTDESGGKVSPGLYVYSLHAGDHVETRKMMLLGSR